MHELFYNGKALLRQGALFVIPLLPETRHCEERQVRRGNLVKEFLGAWLSVLKS